MDLKTKYITIEEFKEFFGIDLEVEIKEDDNPSNTANAFLKRIEVRVASYIDSNFYRNVDFEYPEFSNYQKEHYKLALLEQAMYVLKNGDISVDSGYDQETGIKASRGQLKELAISQNCKEHLILCGLWCRKIKTRARGGIDGWWMY